MVKTDGEDPHEVEQRIGLDVPHDRLHRFTAGGLAVASQGNGGVNDG